MIAVSVIVPVYNVVPYLRRGLDSLVNQTLGDIEIICVDDKSTDGSLEILREYAKKYPKIKLVEFPENCGVSDARNAGMEIATGEYIGFMDPDDFVEYDFYEKLYNAANGADLVKGNIIVFNNLTGQTKQTNNKKIRENIYHFYRDFYTAIYKQKFLTEYKIRFPSKVITTQDLIFIASVTTRAKTINFADDAIYHYMQYNPGSLDGEFVTLQKAKSCLDSFNRLLVIMDDNNLSGDNKKIYLDNLMWLIKSHIVYKKFADNNDIKKFFDLFVKIYDTKIANDSRIVNYFSKHWECPVSWARNYNYEQFIAIYKSEKLIGNILLKFRYYDGTRQIKLFGKTIYEYKK